MPNLRPAARVIALSPSQRVLLVRFQLKTGIFWATPGGGVEADETRRQAAARELAEETGITGVELVGPIWDRTHYFPLHGFEGQNEQYFLARTVDETIGPQFSEAELRAEGVTALRWWTLDEIAASDAVFAPRNLGSLLANLVRDGAPSVPIVLPDQQADATHVSVDALTGLGNHEALAAVLTATVESAGDDAAPALLIVDVDNFKQFNAHNGHAAGDGLLLHLATELTSLVGSEGLVFRSGGDTFAALLRGQTQEAATHLASQVCEFSRDRLAATQAEHCGDDACLGPAAISASAGLVFWVPGMNVDEWLRHAGDAVEAQKRAGKDGVTVWSV